MAYTKGVSSKGKKEREKIRKKKKKKPTEVEGKVWRDLLCEIRAESESKDNENCSGGGLKEKENDTDLKLRAQTLVKGPSETKSEGKKPVGGSRKKQKRKKRG